jgi:O-antigen/teichoic acid export membrane protein
MTKTQVQEPRILKNSIWNIVGQILPILVGVVSIPFLLKNMGSDRFAVLTLIWMITGYFGIFDLGLSRALTQSVAEKLALSRQTEIPDLVNSVLWLMIAVGALAGAVAWAITPYGLEHWIKIPEVVQGGLQRDSMSSEEFRAEVLMSALYVALAIPWIVSSTALKGALEAAHRFDWVNGLRVPLSCSLYVVPVFLSFWNPGLPGIVFSIFVVRVVGFFGYWVVSKRIFPGLRMRPIYVHSAVRPLYHFGFWMTVSNIVGPILSQLDRFYVGAVVSLEAVAYYATPYEMISKIYGLPTAIGSVLFPSMTHAFSKDQAADTIEAHSGTPRYRHTESLYLRSFKYLCLTTFPIMLLAALFSKEILGLWLGAEFAAHSARVLQILALGIFINSIGIVPYTFLQAVGKPNYTAQLHLFELPVFIVMLKTLTAQYGINGTAWAWTLRVCLDSALLLWITHQKVLPVRKFGKFSFWVLRLTIFLIAIAGIYYLIDEVSLVPRMAASFGLVAVFCWTTYHKILDETEREFLHSKMDHLRRLLKEGKHL